MAGINTKILLDNEDFVKSVKEVTGSIKSIEASMHNAQRSISKFTNEVASGIGDTIKGFVGAQAVVGLFTDSIDGIGVAFEKTVNSSQTHGDAFAKQMDMLKASVDSFFVSIAMGDFSSFISNLDNIRKKAGQLSEILDELGTKTLFTNDETKQLEKQKKIQENIAKDRTKSESERNEALSKARTTQKDINELQRSLAATQMTAANATVKTEIAKQGYKVEITDNQINSFLKESNREKYTEDAKKYRELLDASKSTSVTSAGSTYGGSTVTVTDKKAKDALEKFRNTEEGKNAEMAYYFTEMADDEKSGLSAASRLRSQAADLEISISDTELSLNNTEAKINKSAVSNSSKSESNNSKLIDAQRNIQESILAIQSDGYEKERSILVASYQKKEDAAKKSGILVTEQLNAIEAEKAAALEKFDRQYNDKRERINLDNRLSSVEKGGMEELDLIVSLLEQQRRVELEEAKKTGADVLAINDKYRKKEEGARKDHARAILSKRQGNEKLINENANIGMDRALSDLGKAHDGGSIGDLKYNRMKEDVEYAKAYGAQLLKIKHLKEDLIGLDGQDRVNKQHEIDNAERALPKKPTAKKGFAEKVDTAMTPVGKAYEGMNDAISGVDGMVSALDRLHNAFDPEQEASAWQKIMAVWSAMGQVTNTINSINSSIETMRAFTEALTTSKEILGAVDMATTATEIADEAVSTGAVVAGETAKTGAHQTSAIAAAIKWVNETFPFPLSLAMGAAAIAGVIALFAGIPKFADGGMVGGSSFSGDKLLARVNSGEVILNKEQQDNIYRSMTSGHDSSGGGDVRFEIAGTKLVGVLSNINRQQNKRN
ncbi:hypothetical protein Barb7_00100 [Bacteroidales bacterium Barb7]|nr:hypothetical protein Barb7_00100 [Bacteroidales bacterium Barb7]